MRVLILWIAVGGLAVYAWKDWFRSLCGLILLMAVIEHEDMPKSIMGIQGLNLWNLLFASILLAWLASRRRERLTWDLPAHLNVLLLLYLGVILIGFSRALLDRTNLEYYPLKSLLSEELINTIKWVLPAVLLFDGCRTPRRQTVALLCLLAMYFLFAAQVLKRMPPSSVFGGGEQMQQIRLKVCRSIGYSSVDMSTMLAGAFWGVMAAAPLIRHKAYKVLVVGSAGMILLAQASTGGRAGYLAWGVIGVVLCLVRWRKYVILLPAFLLLFYVSFPGAAARALTGFGEPAPDGRTVTDWSLITSGRSDNWGQVIGEIEDAPLLGYGRLAAIRTGLWEATGGELPHPHNLYLEWVLDNGLLGLIPVIVFYGIVIVLAARLFRDRAHPLCSGVGGLALAAVLAQLVGGIGSQHFYPRESTLGMWAAIFLALRLAADRSRVPARVPWRFSCVDIATDTRRRILAVR